jgi:LCP family protein required for cell wall assembly
MYEGLKNLDVSRRAPRVKGAGAPPGGPTHPKSHKVARFSFRMSALILGLLVVAGTCTYLRVKDAIDEGKISELKRLADAAPGQPMNILVLGSDSRKGVTSADKKKGLGGPSGRRSDVVMLMHIGATGRRSTLVSLPRDLRVEIPGHGLDKINAAYAYGGHNLVIKTVERFTGLTINHYLEVNFFGFRGMVNAVGGVAVRTTRPLFDEKAKLDIPQPGCWILDGDQALAYVRARNPYPNADIGRIDAQQGFLRSLAAKVRSIKVLVNPPKIVKIADQIGAYFRYDPDFPGDYTFDRARSIAAKLATTDERKLDFRVVPHTFQTINGISYVIPIDGESRALFNALRADRNPPDVGLTSQSVPDRNDIRVQILNGAGKGGLATKITNRLRRKHFEMLAPGNTRRRAHTQIRFNPQDELRAKVVAKFFPGAKLKEVSEDFVGDVLVYIGRDYLSLDGSPAPTMTPPAAEDCQPLR